MGSSLSKLYDDHDDYEKLCDRLNIHDSQRKAIHGVDSFYKHGKELLNDLKYKEIAEEMKNSNSYLYHKFI